MSDESDLSSEPTFTSFIPLTILLSGFIIWFGFQDYELNAQRGALNHDLSVLAPKYSEAQNVSAHYVALMRDLVKTAATDDAAKAIVSDALKAGLIHAQKPAANSADTSAAPPTDQSK